MSRALMGCSTRGRGVAGETQYEARNRETTSEHEDLAVPLEDAAREARRLNVAVVVAGVARVEAERHQRLVARVDRAVRPVGRDVDQPPRHERFQTAGALGGFHHHVTLAPE